ncbi:MAG TPA: tetratricopeptide repeat protein [Acidobacteriaceae bacterium]|nr:tetratricopeptide repeat protein [Acidobacteriaceae bacterium]
MRPSSRSLLPSTAQCAVLILTLGSPGLAKAQTVKQQPISLARARLHDSDQWRDIEKHLPDPATAAPKTLEQEADILRARKFPEDALDFYRYALQRGGNPSVLTNKMGLSELEMKNFQLAEASFNRAVKINKKDAEAWNNLGAAQFIDGNASRSISSYKHAIKLDHHSAVYHANLATAYFETKNFNGARKELATAMKLDPDIFNHKEGAGGVEAHVLSSEDRARFSYEMAKLYAENGLEQQMLHSLAQAGEAGMDLQKEMRKDPVLSKYLTDKRVVILIQNAEAIRTGHPVQLSASEPTPANPL